MGYNIMKFKHIDKIKYILIGFVIAYILYCNVKREDFVEHLISYKSDKVDILSRFSLGWLKHKVKSMDIPKDEISVNLRPKEAFAVAIIRHLPEKHREYMLKLKTYSLEKLRVIALENGIITSGLDKRALLNAIDKATSPKNQFKKWSKHAIVPEEEEEEEEIEDDSSKSYARLTNCPRIYKKCIKDRLLNDYKYTDCLNQDNYEKCMTSFNNKISDSKYIGGGTNFACNYKDMELLCMNRNPDSCKDSNYLNCPCKTPSDNRDDYEYKRKNEHDNHHQMLRDKDHYLLSSSIKHSRGYVPEPTLKVSTEYMNDHYKDLLSKRDTTYADKKINKLIDEHII